jgi:hypothetical protein
MNYEQMPASGPEQVDEVAREEARQRMISRRRAIRAGLIAVPVMLTLRAVPARANGGSLFTASNHSTHQCPTYYGRTASHRCKALGN